jgi:redox-sensitive bicupin YhaK (pirin superfamily)
MKTILYPAKERGHVNLGWLDSFHSFSFGQYHDPAKVHFGALRVVNDDSIAGGGGFGTHPHDNMEIVTIPLEGKLAHKDSTGNEGIISKGDVQIMSAGTGIRHSEYNASSTEYAKLLQIWVFPKQKNIKPVYGQKTFDLKDRNNNWQVVVSPDASEKALNINQDARFSLVNLEAGKSISYDMKWKDAGLYLFVIDGAVQSEGQTLANRDALGVSETSQVQIKAMSNAQLLAIEVPLVFKA